MGDRREEEKELRNDSSVLSPLCEDDVEEEVSLEFMRSEPKAVAVCVTAGKYSNEKTQKKSALLKKPVG